MSESRTYHVFYNGTKRELVASSSYAAQKLAAQLLKVPAKKQHMISVVLADTPVATASL
jgi:hypothetical protein